MGARRMFALVTMLPVESALAGVMRSEQDPEPEPAALPAGKREQPVGGWGDLARTLSEARAMKKRG